jgi:hypothetical protein
VEVFNSHVLNNIRKRTIFLLGPGEVTIVKGVLCAELTEELYMGRFIRKDCVASHAALPMVMLEISYCTSDFEMRGPGPPGW